MVESSTDTHVTESSLYEIARRRGFFYISNEIYGGLTGFYDYGNIGTLLKKNIENLWRGHFLGLGDSFSEIEPSNVMPEKAFVASGHIKNFVDPSVKCRKCGSWHRADQLVEKSLGIRAEGKSTEELSELIKEHKIRCPNCGGELGEVRVLNMMFQLKMGSEGDTIAYLRPETAQGVYVNFLRQFNVMRSRLPMGLGIVGKAFRNEISPRQLLIRQREFTQAELQVFFDPSKVDECEKWDEVKGYKLLVMEKDGKTKKETCEHLAKNEGLPKFYLYHLAKSQEFFIGVLKFPEDKFRLRRLSEEEKAFYNKIHFDAEVFLESLGEYKEVGGIHYRTDHDLLGHQEVSKKSHEISYEGKSFVPHVIELTVGIDRAFYAAMDLFYRPATKERDWEWFAFPPEMAPYAFAVFPLMGKDGLPELADKVYRAVKKARGALYDGSGSIGRRYARADEIGVPFAITIDYDSLRDNAVTIRKRDDTKQVRVKIEGLEEEAKRLCSTESM